ncbi:Uncharacterised protein [Mycoplasmopsis edwardii]|uniref:Uncharacterized protein n=1 Tax=Mycoplasmopsis edwardii TaxID=53558 RepID=A0A3B0Q4G5_9BACT|nr:Uncharacterised protein [Mycoplasmopsis edwardii]
MLISPLGNDCAIICEVPGIDQYVSITIPPVNNPMYEGINKAANGIEIFLKTYLKKISDVLNPFDLAIST